MKMKFISNGKSGMYAKALHEPASCTRTTRWVGYASLIEFAYNIIACLFSSMFYLNLSEFI